MKRILSWLLALVLLLAIGGAFVYLYKKSQAKTVIYETESAEIADITKKTVATGSLVPRRQVEVKPKVTGVLTELKYENPGQPVKLGDPIGKITIIPDAQQMNTAESQTRTAQIALEKWLDRKRRRGYQLQA